MDATPCSDSSSPTPAQAESPQPAATSCKPNVRIVNGKTVNVPPGFNSDRPLYRPHGKWAWTEDREILSLDPGTRLGSGLEGTVNLKVGYINDKEVIYISKLSSVWDTWRLLFPYLYLNASSKFLRPLQGDCVPWVIGTFHCNGGRIGVAQDLPHPTGWREADMFLEDPQKEAIIAAYQKIHDHGVLHGDAEYRHWLIGDDKKVTIIDFGFARVNRKDEGARKVGLECCSGREVQQEMRKVKFMLDWKDSRASEYRLARLRHDREEKDAATRRAVTYKPGEVFSQGLLPEEPLTEEEKASPVPALKLYDLDAWSYGDTWTAHHYRVIRHKGCAEIVKVDIVRPPIPQKIKTEDPVAAHTPDSPGASVPTTAPAFEHTDTPAEDASANDTVDASDSQLPPMERHGPRPIGPRVRKHDPLLFAISQAMGMTDASLAPNVANTGKRSREPEDSGSDNESVAEQKVSEGDEGVEPAKKRQRSADASTSTPSEPETVQNPPPTPVVPSMSIEPCPAVASSSVIPPARKPAPKVTEALTENAWKALGLRPDPTHYDLSAPTRELLTTEAFQAWTLFSLASEHVKGLQNKLDEEKHKVETLRSIFLRTFLLQSPEERTVMWDEMGQPDARQLLGLLPELESPKKDPKPRIILHSARTNLNIARSRVAPNGVRSIRQPKGNPRVAAIKRSEPRPRVPSKLSQTVEIPPTMPPGTGQSSSGSPPPEELEGPSPELKAKLDQMDRYREVLLKRAQLEEEKDSSLMIPPPSLHRSMHYSSKKVASRRDSRANKHPTTTKPSFTPANDDYWMPSKPLHPKAQRIANMMEELMSGKPVPPLESPTPEDPRRCAWAPVAGSSTGTFYDPGKITDMPQWEYRTEDGQTSPPSEAAARSSAKRKREETSEDESPAATPEVKKSKLDPCGLM